MFQNKIPLEDQIEFARNLSTLLSGGISINDAVRSLADQARSKNLKKILAEISLRLEKGVSLYSAMSEAANHFNAVVISLVKAGEVSGSLPDNLNFLAEWLSRDSNLRKEISSVTLYPKLVISATIILGGGLSIFILPRLVPLFQSLNVQLPWITRKILQLSVFLQKDWLDVVAGLIALVAAYVLLMRVRPVKYVVHRSLMYIPFVGEVIRDYQLALFCQLMATLLKSGLTFDEALGIAYVGTSNLYYQKVLKEAQEKVVEGVTLTSTLKQYPRLYPVNFTNLLSVGENSGTVEESFTNLAAYYNQEINLKTKRLPIVIEPVLLILIGIAVATLAISIILPIYTLTGSFSQ